MEKAKKRGIGFFHLIVVFSSVLLYLFQKGEGKVPGEELFLASLLYLVCCIPSFVYFRRKELNIPYFPFFCILFFSYFGAGIFINQRLFKLAYFSPDEIDKALILSLWGMIVLLIAFYSTRIFLEAIVPRLSIKLDYRKTSNLAVKLFLFTFFMQRFFFKQAALLVAGLNHFIDSLPLLCICLFLVMYLRGGIMPKYKVWLWLIIIPQRFLYILATGSFGPLVYETSALFFVYFYLRQKIPVITTVALTLLYFFIWGARDDFRGLTWYGGPYSGADSLVKATVYFRLLCDRGLRNYSSQLKDTTAAERLSARTNHLITFSTVVRDTPAFIPYWNGYTYRTLFSSLIPRFLWPDKPKKILGQEFGQRYQLLSPQDLTTSYNLPLIVEFYINFGEIGVILGMIILGIVFRILYCLVNHPQCEEGGMVIGAVLFTNLLNIESDFSLIFGNILQYALLFYFIVKIAGLPKDKRQDVQVFAPS